MQVLEYSYCAIKMLVADKNKILYNTDTKVKRKEVALHISASIHKWKEIDDDTKH